MVLFACLAALSPVFASELSDDLAARRSSVMERLGPESLLVLQSAPVRNYSGDVDYEYRQDSYLYYLTGIDQEGTRLVLMPGNETRKELLFVPSSEAAQPGITAPPLTMAEAREQSGIQTILPASQFEPFLAAVLSRGPFRLAPADDPASEYQRFFHALDADRAKVALTLERRQNLSGPLPPTAAFAASLKERFSGFTTVDVTDMLGELRQIKTPVEQSLLEQSAAISSEAHLAAMRATRAGGSESEVKAALAAVFLARGALGWSYPPIVASGPNATILHYAKSSRRMEAGDLLLVDAAANYQYLTADITRTYPVNGTFSAAQKDIYQVVLKAQDAGVSAVHVGARIGDIELQVATVLKEGLLKLGLLTDGDSQQYRVWYTHAAVHFIGIDVHDPGDFTRPLAPGMAFVIEPGIYIREGALDELPATPDNIAFRAQVRPAYERYRNIGVRIEDSFLLTNTGLKHLSATVPRTIEDIERVLASRR